MANILDIRRRIRSVVNTRQITKAMKTVSAAKLRRAQESALAARPYSQMLTNVLKSLISRADIYDPVTGQAASSSAGRARRKEHPPDRGHWRQRAGWRVQHQYPEDGVKIHPVETRSEYRHRMHRPQRPRLHAPPLSDRSSERLEDMSRDGRFAHPLGD